MLVPKDFVMREDQTRRPVKWVAGPFKLPTIPNCSDEVMEALWGDSKTSRRIKTFSHDDNGVHWLATRSGTPMHMDPAYTRWTHQLIIRNDGYVLTGLDEDVLPPMMVTGTLACLDTWSPHQVIVDPRFGNDKPRHKVQLVVDRDEPLTVAEALDLLVPRLADRDPLERMANEKEKA